MNILFIVPDYSVTSSGITTVVSQLAEHLLQYDSELKVIVTGVGTSNLSEKSGVIFDFIQSKRTGKVGEWRLGLEDKITDMVKKYDISVIHVHGVWRAANLAGLAVAKKNNIPVVLSPHGMLEPWQWQEQGFLKKYKKIAYLNLFFRNRMPNNLVFHAITEGERESLLRQFQGHDVISIPNSIDMDEKNYRNLDRVKLNSTILFIGRLHPVKGVDILLEAFYKAGLEKHWKLQIIGPEENAEYVKSLKSFVIEKRLEDRVEFLGPVFGEEKLKILQSAWVHVLPSYSEVVGMVNLEASKCKVPSITTHETGLLDWEKGGGYLIHPNVEQIAESINKASQWSASERSTRGKASFDFVCRCYSWKAVLPQWKQMYLSLRSNND
ncbi:MAG: glycosyltransferase [Zetaproteobacteria bacterium]|nr:glycosyltransferase [Zetaproteobacteria bacterium]